MPGDHPPLGSESPVGARSDSPATGAPRDARLDFVRGAALLVIYSDHVRGNALAPWTPAALGFSDMAEVFVFVSGYVGGLGMSRRLEREGFLSCQRRALVRAVQLYLAYVVTLAVLVVLGHTFPELRGIIAGTPGRVALWDRPTLSGAMLLSVLSLREPLGHLGILPLYMLLVAALPFMLWLARRRFAAPVALTFALYVAAQWLAQRGTALLPGWYFDPPAWQAVFFIGALVAAAPPAARHQWLSSRPAIVAACLALGVLLAWQTLLGGAAVPLTGKSHQEPFRLMHFLAIVIIGRMLLPRTGLDRGPAALVALCGRNSLIVYCAGAVFAAVASVILWRHHGEWTWQLIVNLGGWAGCVGCAWIWEQIKRARSRRRRADGGH